MGEVAAFLFEQRLSKATRRRYASVWKRYSVWCEGLEEAPLLVSEEKATGYMATLAEGGMKAATVVRTSLNGLSSGRSTFSRE